MWIPQAPSPIAGHVTPPWPIALTPPPPLLPHLAPPGIISPMAPLGFLGPPAPPRLDVAHPAPWPYEPSTAPPALLLPSVTSVPPRPSCTPVPPWGVIAADPSWSSKPSELLGPIYSPSAPRAFSLHSLVFYLLCSQFPGTSLLPCGAFLLHGMAPYSSLSEGIT